jgi:hypothetical protein
MRQDLPDEDPHSALIRDRYAQRCAARFVAEDPSRANDRRRDHAKK